MQLAIVEFARHVIGYDDAHSVELDPNTTHPVIHLMPDQDGVEDIGGTLRLGSYPCILDRIQKLMSCTVMRPFMNVIAIAMRSIMIIVKCCDRQVLTLSGISPDGRIVEMIELKEHPVLPGYPGSSGAEIQTEPSPSSVPWICSGGTGIPEPA